MKTETKEKQTEELVSVPKQGLLSLVASRLMDRNLFPQKVEEAKKYFRKLKGVHS